MSGCGACVVRAEVQPVAERSWMVQSRSSICLEVIIELYTQSLIMALNLKNIPVEELVKKATKFVEENPVAVGVSAAVTVLTGLMLFRRAELRRDGKDYNNQIAGGMSLLNNTDHTLKKNEFAESIEDYENMFGGARKEIGKITTEDSIEVRKAKYATMVNHFYNLVTDFYEWGWCQVSVATTC
ncbi:hypothetical protein EON65_10010 [archaeon]|nr:MAG: hypothetical protein EON65_10010 [archaeon]